MINDELIVKYLVGEAEPHEVAMVEEWRKASEENEKRLKQFETLWETSAAVKNHTSVNVDMAWQKVQQKISPKNASKGRMIRMNQRWLMAASFALLLGIGIFLFNRNTTPVEEMLTAKVTTKTENLQLQDGSKIIIRNGSLSYPKVFKGQQRKVILNSGRAFFDIASDKAKPFIITTGNTSVTVVGTEFEIITENETTQVMVKEGKVRFNTPKGEIFLTAGMGARYSKKTNELENMQPEDNNSFSYVSGQLNFANQTLKQVLLDLNEYYQDNTIELDNEMLENCRITASFDHDKLETVLAVIAVTLNLEVEELADGKTIVLKGKGCNP